MDLICFIFVKVTIPEHYKKKQDNPFWVQKVCPASLNSVYHALNTLQPWQHFATQRQRSRTKLYHHAEFGRM